MENQDTGFPAIASQNSQLLILGSMPSVASLEKKQYYGHPRNQFWPILGQLFGFDPKRPYHERVDLALAAGVAIWDVIHQCYRPGSADVAIEPDSITTQNFDDFFMAFPNIQHVYFNGRKAEQVYRAKVLPELSSDFDYLEYHSLPSTSPAFASRPLADKIAAWQLLKKHQAPILT